ncbi:MAG: hypothetical protein AB7S38_30690 [Vulcanimicrobiota bacterium]
MRKTLLLLLVLLLGARAQDGLELVVGAKGPTTVKVGDNIELEAWLINRGKRTVTVVKPGDGSESAWREPYVYFSAERRQGDRWTAVKRHGIGRCGLYDPDWEKDRVGLEPGDKLELMSWIPGPQAFFDLEPGQYRFRVHYEFAEGEHGKGRPKEVKATLTVVSEPIEVTVTP